MAKKQNDEETGEMPQFSLAELMAHARQVDQNVADEDHAAAKAQAMEDFGLVEPTRGKKAAPVPPPAPPAPPVAPVPPAPPVENSGDTNKTEPNPFADS